MNRRSILKTLLLAPFAALLPRCKAVSVPPIWLLKTGTGKNRKWYRVPDEPMEEGKVVGDCHDAIRDFDPAKSYGDYVVVSRSHRTKELAVGQKRVYEWSHRCIPEEYHHLITCKTQKNNPQHPLDKPMWIVSWRYNPT